MAHTALGHLEELKKKELVLAAMTMSSEEFEQLVAQRNQLIVESAVASGAHINSDAPIPPPELIVNSTMTTSNNASTDTSGDRGGVVGDEDGI